MKLRRFLMEEWLASHKDTCRYNLGESGMPDITIGQLLDRCGAAIDALSGIVLKDHDTQGTFRLRKAISETYSQQWITPETVTVTTGTSEALFILFNLILAQRNGVVAPFPAFQALTEVPRALGADLRYYDLTHENGFLPDPDNICSLIDDNTGIVIINTPHNPSGVLFPDNYAETVIEKAAFHGAVVLADEHYRYLPVGSNPPLISLAREDGSVIATGSITKCFGVIGLRTGWIIAPPSLISQARDFRDYLTHTLSPASDYLASLTLEHADEFISPARHTIIQNRDALIKMAASCPELSLVNPDAGIVCFPKYNMSLSSDEFTAGLLERYGVFVLPGSSFEIDKHIRINLGQPPDLFREAVAYIHSYISELHRTI